MPLSFRTISGIPDNVTPPPTGSPPTFTLQPTAQTAVEGSSFTFTAAATGTGPITVSWQYSTTGTGGPWIAITGVTGGTLTEPAVMAKSGNYYRAVAVNTAGATNSDPAPLTVTPQAGSTANPPGNPRLGWVWLDPTAPSTTLINTWAPKESVVVLPASLKSVGASVKAVNPNAKAVTAITAWGVAESKFILLAGWSSPTPQQMVDNKALIEGMGYRGLTFEISGLTDALMQPTAISLTTMRNYFAPLANQTFTHCTRNYIQVVVRQPNGANNFTSGANWNTVAQNWANLAQVVAEQPLLEGIAFDTEEYYGAMWAGTDGTGAYARGSQCMTAMVAVNPNVKIEFYTGPRWYKLVDDTDPGAFNHATYGHAGTFFAGMVHGAIGSNAVIIDGSEFYGLNTLAEYTTFRSQMLDETLYPYVPSGDYPYWNSGKVRAGFGIYNAVGYAGDGAADLQQHLTDALKVADDHVWLYDERYQWTGPGGRSLAQQVATAANPPAPTDYRAAVVASAATVAPSTDTAVTYATAAANSWLALSDVGTTPSGSGQWAINQTTGAFINPDGEKVRLLGANGSVLEYGANDPFIFNYPIQGGGGERATFTGKRAQVQSWGWNFIRVPVVPEASPGGWSACADDIIALVDEYSPYKITVCPVPIGKQALNLAGSDAAWDPYDDFWDKVLTQRGTNPYLWVNFGGESWDGSSSGGGWRSQANYFYSFVRARSSTAVVMITAPFQGQDATDVVTTGEWNLFKSGKTNIILDWHTYAAPGGAAWHQSGLTTVRNAGIPVMVGEFGYQANRPGSACCGATWDNQRAVSLQNVNDWYSTKGVSICWWIATGDDNSQSIHSLKTPDGTYLDVTGSNNEAGTALWNVRNLTKVVA